MSVTYLFLAQGFEEVEAIAVVDVLRRGGVDVRTVSITDDHQVAGAHQVTVQTDLSLEQIQAEEAVCLIFPGGMPGAQNLSECEPLIRVLQQHFDRKKMVAAICAAPALILSRLKTTEKLRVTCYPGFEKYLSDFDVVADGVVVDGKVITGKGPGFAVKFGLTVLEQLRSAEVAAEVAAGMLL